MFLYLCVLAFYSKPIKFETAKNIQMKFKFASYKRASKEVKLASSNSGIFHCIHFHTKALSVERKSISSSSTQTKYRLHFKIDRILCPWIVTTVKDDNRKALHYLS